jgi:hypothetical protein
MIRTARGIGLTLATLLLCHGAGCSRSSGTGTRQDLTYGSSSDVEAILRENGVIARPLRCVNPNQGGAVTRAVACALSLKPDQFTAPTANVPLHPGKPTPYGDRDNCETTPGQRSTDPGVEVLVGKNMKVPNGVGPIELHVARDAGAACIEIHYPWSS